MFKIVMLMKGKKTKENKKQSDVTKLRELGETSEQILYKNVRKSF